MQPKETARIVAMLAAYFPHQIPEETGKAWAMELLPRSYQAAEAAVRAVARKVDRITLARFLAEVRTMEKRAEQITAPPARQIPSRLAEPERERIAASLCRDVANGEVEPEDYNRELLARLRSAGL